MYKQSNFTWKLIVFALFWNEKSGVRVASPETETLNVFGRFLAIVFLRYFLFLKIIFDINTLK